MDFKPMTEERPDRECLCLLRRFASNEMAPGCNHYGPAWFYRLAVWIPLSYEYGDFGALLGAEGNGWADPYSEEFISEGEDEDGDWWPEWTEWLELPQPATDRNDPRPEAPPTLLY